MALALLGLPDWLVAAGVLIALAMLFGRGSGGGSGGGSFRGRYDIGDDPGDIGGSGDFG